MTFHDNMNQTKVARLLEGVSENWRDKSEFNDMVFLEKRNIYIYILIHKGCLHMFP